MNGFFNIWKPEGMSSAAVVAVLRRLTGEKRIGHAGTLDPEAAGVLPLMAGKATRLFDYLVDKEKEYLAVIAFGTATDTQDATGTVTETGTCYPDEETIRRQALRLTGSIRQRPSMYSAIKVGGQPLYARARRGEKIEVPERTVQVKSITLEREMPDHGWEIRVRCGKGTYIRTLCHDLGKLCGCPAHMRSLLRTQSGIFTLNTAIPLEDATRLAQEGRLAEKLLPPDYPLRHLTRTNLLPAMEKLVKNGGKIPVEQIIGTAPEDGELTTVYLDGNFWGIARREGNRLIWRAVLAPEGVQA